MPGEVLGVKRVERRGANHTLHLILSLLTCGLWAVTGWPVAAAMGRRTVTRMSGHEIRFDPRVGAYQALYPVPGQPDEMVWNPYSGRWVPRG